MEFNNNGHPQPSLSTPFYQQMYAHQSNVVTNQNSHQMQNSVPFPQSKAQIVTDSNVYHQNQYHHPTNTPQFQQKTPQMTNVMQMPHSGVDTRLHQMPQSVHKQMPPPMVPQQSHPYQYTPQPSVQSHNVMPQQMMNSVPHQTHHHIPPPKQIPHQSMPNSNAMPYSSYAGQTSPVPPPPMLAHSGTVTNSAPHTFYNGGDSQPSMGHENVDQMSNKFGGMSINQSWSQMWNQENVNLMSEKDIRTKAMVADMLNDVKDADSTNCSKDIMRCTLTKVPDCASLLQKSRLPFGILIHPFKDDDEIPVIHDSPIVRCRSCRTYINPHVRLLDQRRWQCNLCHRLNDLPEEFLYDYNSRQMIDVSTRPELNYGSVEFIASVEYMVRPPQPAAYLFVFDCSRHATQIGYIPILAKTLFECLDEIPGDSRTLIGFIGYDSKLHFFHLGDKQPIHLVMSDIHDVFLPFPDNLLVNLQSKRVQIEEFLNEVLPPFPCDAPGDTVLDTGSALGPALSAAYKVIAPYGGRITLIQAALPSIGGPNDGSVLTNREDPNNRVSSNTDTANLTPLLNPGTDFYKKLALECSEHQVSVDLFNLSPQYSDLATVGSVSKFCGGSIYYYGGSSNPNNSILSRFEADMKHYLTRSIGFESVMRMRCTRGISIHTFHGNFFVRSTDLLALPNVNPDSGFAMQISIDDDLKDYNHVCFQAAVLFTSSRGERRIRVHTLSLPIVTILADVLNAADTESIIGMLSKMAVDRSLSSSITDAREALINSVIDLLSANKLVSSAQTGGGLLSAYSTRLLPLYVLALLKHCAFRVGISTKMDERVYAMERMKSLPLKQLMLYIYPNLYPIHNEFDSDNEQYPCPLQLSFANIERNGVYLLDTYDNLYVYICKSVHPQWLADVFGVTQWTQIPDDGDNIPTPVGTNIALKPPQLQHNPVTRIQLNPIQSSPEQLPIVPLPVLENATSRRIHSFIDWLIEQRPFKPQFNILREDSRLRSSFIQYMYDDRNESAFSYYEFLQHLQQMKN